MTAEEPQNGEGSTVETYQFDVPQGPIRYEDWVAHSLGVAFRNELERREERGYYTEPDEEQTRLVTDGGRDAAETCRRCDRDPERELVDGYCVVCRDYILEFGPDEVEP